MSLSGFLPSRRSLIAAGLVLFLFTGVLLLLPEVVRRVAVEKLQKRLALHVRIEDVDFNPLTGRARAINLVIGRAGTQSPVVKLASLDVEISYWDLLKGKVTLNALSFHSPELLVERMADGGWNMIRMIQPADDEDGPGLPLTLERLAIQSGRLVFKDSTQTPPFEVAFDAIDLKAGTISTLPEIALTETTFTLKVGVGAGSIAVNGSAVPLGQPPSVELTARWKDLEPSIFEAYLPAQVRLDLSGTLLNGEARYALKYQKGQISAHNLAAGFQLGSVGILTADGSDRVLAVEKLIGREVQIDFLGRITRIGELALVGPSFIVERNAEGVFNLARLFPENDTVEFGTSGMPFSVKAAVTRVEGGTIELLDRTLDPAVRNVYRDVDLTLEDMDLAPGAEPGRVTGTARLDGAAVRIGGTLRPRPIAARLDIDATGVSLEGFQGYLAVVLGAGSLGREGELNINARVDLAAGENGKVGLEVSGKANGSSVIFNLPGSDKPFFSAEGFFLDLTRMKIIPALDVEFAHIQLTRPEFWIKRSSDGSINFQGMLKPSKNIETGTPSSFPLVIHRFDLLEGRIDFMDATVSPPLTNSLSQLTVELRPIANDDRSSLNLNGTVGESIPLKFTGWLALSKQPPRIELTGGIRDYELSRLNPYTEKHIQYPIRRGRVSSDGRYALDGNGEFSSDSEITVRHLELGEKVGDEFDKQIGIPLKGALSLLESVDGTIRLTIPLSGNLNNPKFSVAPLLWSAIQNSLVKALIAPFRLIGNVLTLGGKIGEIRIEPIPFRAGTLEIEPSARERFSQLAGFLIQKPRVKLEVRGRSSSQEIGALKARRLRQQIEAEKAPTVDSALARLYSRAGGSDSIISPVSAEAKEAYLLERMQVTDEDLGKFALERARVIERALVQQGVAAERLFVVSKDQQAVTDKAPGQTEFKVLY